jgi:hypothetical protein
MFSLGLLYLGFYFGFLSLGQVEQQLDRLGAHSPGATALLGEETGRGEGLFIVFAFLFLTPVAVVLALSLPMFASAATAAFFNRLLRLPEAMGSLLFWVALAVVTWVEVDAWLPWVQWLVGLVARAFYLALQAK